MSAALKFLKAFLPMDRLVVIGSTIGKALAWVWQKLITPITVPFLFVAILAVVLLYSSYSYVRLVRESIAYQDSIIYAQDTELWRLRADTLEANYEIRQLYLRLDQREKQEVIFFSQLRTADDNALQIALDSLYGKHAQTRAGLPDRQPTQAGVITSILSGSELAEKFNSISGWSKRNTARQVQSH